MEITIHKINITAEAKVDIAKSLGLCNFDWCTLKADTEEYISRQSKAGRIPWLGYFRVDYIEENSGTRLKLFLYKGQVFGLMQIWVLVGVCKASDWSQEIEDSGSIRTWLKN